MTSAQVKSVVVAPTAFKGTLGPTEAARAMAEGVHAVWPGAEVRVRPLSDGGNGLLEACQAVETGALEEHQVSGPLGAPLRARLLRQGSQAVRAARAARAVIESAEACGLHLVPPERRDPLRATTRGVGELISAAVSGGPAELILGLGGSATVDGGTGMARALGWSFLDRSGRPLPEGGGSLVDLARIEPPGRRLGVRVLALCDVENPLNGPLGAARVYGPQKGAGPEAVTILDAGLARLAELIEGESGISVGGLPGAGAAGGLGAGARAFLDAELTSGAAWMMERARIGRLLETADLLVTGEGHFDAQSGMGKLTGRALEAAAAAGVPSLLVCGRVDGPLPPGTVSVDGGGGVLTADDLSDLTATACRALSGEDRLQT